MADPDPYGMQHRSARFDAGGPGRHEIDASDLPSEIVGPLHLGPPFGESDLGIDAGDLIQVSLPGEPTRYLIVTDVEEAGPGSATISTVGDPFTDDPS